MVLNFKKMKHTVFITILAFFIASFNVSNRVEALIHKEIKSVFGIENYTKENLSIPLDLIDSLPIKITEKNFFKIYSGNENLGYYYLGQAYGKADYFDFIVIFDSDLIVSKVKILVYREDHGGEVGSKRWLKQFIGTTAEKELKYQQDIAAISGATISAKSMTNEVNRLLRTIHALNTKKLL